MIIVGLFENATDKLLSAIHTTTKRLRIFIGFEMSIFAWTPVRLENRKYVWLKRYIEYGTVLHDCHDIISTKSFRVTAKDYAKITHKDGYVWQKTIL